MENTIISEGKTTNEAIENGLKKLNVSKEKVDIKVLESEDKRSFFSILAPRVVKVELTLKENVSIKEDKKDNKESKETSVKRRPERIRREIELSSEEQDKAVENMEKFLSEFVKSLSEDAKYDIEKTKSGLNVNLNSDNIGYLIGYRGETLYALQNILVAVAGKDINNRVRVILDIEGYKAKREKTLENLADKVAKTVVRNRKSVKLEPMQAYERKIIHSKLQGNNKVETSSIGEEPYRRIVVSFKK